MEDHITIKPFLDGLLNEELKGSECAVCREKFLPPRPICKHCGSNKMVWIKLSDTGIVQAFTVVNLPLTRFRDLCPYTVGIVKLDDGPSISGMLVGEKKISIGSNVKTRYLRLDDKTVLGFEA
jgi:uncharacterized OB-fold protein